MTHPLVIAHHPIWTAYGWWLPDDPRGSGSHTVYSDVLAELDEVHHGRKKVQPPGREVRQFCAQAATLLKHPLLKFDESERTIIGVAFGEVIVQEEYTCYVCVVMPDHVHLLIRKHKHTAEEMAANLMHGSRAALIAVERRDPTHPTWVGGTPWSVFLDHPHDIRRTSTHVEKNPLPLRLSVQRWGFVSPYDNWPLHPDRSPNSPYANRLRELGRYPHYQRRKRRSFFRRLRRCTICLSL